MAIDLGQSGGQRPSRSSRSAGANLEAPQTRVTRTDTPRTVSTPGGFAQADAIRSVGKSLSSFFPALDQFAATEHAEEMDRIAVENTKEITRIENAVRSDPKGARDAMISQDFSKFIPDDELRRRRVIANTFKSLVAAQMANEDYEAGLMDAIMKVPAGGNPDAVVAAFIKKQTQDSDPVFSQVYGRTIAKRAARQVQRYKAQRLEQQRRGLVDPLDDRHRRVLAPPG